MSLLTKNITTASARLARVANIMSSRTVYTAPPGKEVYIVAAARTPIGSFNGSLKALTAPQLGTVAVKAALAQPEKPIDPTVIEELYFGQVMQGGVGQAPARQVALGAGLPETTEATTINKVCASGLKAVILAAQNLQLGQREAMVAGGMESMSNVPFYFPRNASFGHVEAKDGVVHDGLWDVYNQFHMGNCAENAAKKHGVTREDQDKFAIESYKRAAAAWAAGKFDKEIAPVTITVKGKDTIVKEDEEFKKVMFDKIPGLRPVFDKQGTVTAANASTLNDGASAVVLMTKEKAEQLGLKPLAKIVSYADAAMAPIDFPVAPTKAIPLALDKAGLTVQDIALFEINEAFSAVSKVCEKVLQLDPAKVNPLGGAVALGHPLGSSGSRILVTLVHQLKPGQLGVAGVCNGGGAASAMVVEGL